MPQTVYISVGSNMGDKTENCRKGIGAIGGHPNMSLVSTAPFYKTAPMDYKEQGWFINTVIEVTTDLSPRALLVELQKIQRAVGRKESTIRFGPRVLDLDIIFFGSETIESDKLNIPHPRMHQRRFVLQPLCDLTPNFVHPVIKKEVRLLLREIDPQEQPLERVSISD